VAERALAAIADSQQNGLSIFVAWEQADLLAQATASAQRLREGRPLSPLDGVPVAVKDELDLRGFGTSVGTRFLGKQPAAEDSTAVARLRAAGALLLGKVNMHEIGIGVTGQNPHHGTVRNPYDPQRHTGGSSSGSAAAVAAGFCPIAIGADGGGSIRIPASLCGVVGLKPTYGRVSETGAAPLDWSVAHIGPLGATARDVALGYAAIAGLTGDPNTLHQPALTLEALKTSICTV
jgi:Asp-tRNA(Asn)/Glu-tRNA(Gln) amidotransferase A subunit family amidase